MTWEHMWGYRPRIRAMPRIILSADNDKSLPVTRRKRTKLSAERIRELDNQRIAVMRYLAGGRIATYAEISDYLNADVRQVIGCMHRAGLLRRVSAVRAKWMVA